MRSVHLPLVLPPVVTGWLLLMLFGVRGPVGAMLQDWFGIRLVFTTAGASAGLRGDDLPGDGARHPPVAGGGRSRAGAGRAHARRRAARPVAQHHPAAGLARHAGRRRSSATPTCLGEFGAVITFAANIPGETQTLPLAIYAALQMPGGEAKAAQLSLVSLDAGAGRPAGVGMGWRRGSDAALGR